MTRGLFLDRDGVINVDKGYVHRVEDFVFLPGIFELCATAQQLGFLPIVVTNQAGIGRGYYTEGDYLQLTDWMLERFNARGIRIGRVYHCPFHPTAGVGKYRRDSYDRKPNPGMILRARADFDLDLTQSVLIGDKDSDIGAGRAAGVAYNIRLSPQLSIGEGAMELAFADLATIEDWLRGRSDPACARDP